jgi:hypothetical protein
MSKKIKLELNRPLLNMEGVAFEDTTMAKFIAGRLYNAEQGDPLKFLDWSTELHTTGSIEVDESDFNTILEVVKSTPKLGRGILGQIVRTFNVAKA